MHHNANNGDMPVEGERVLVFSRNEKYPWHGWNVQVGTFGRYEDGFPYFKVPTGDVPVGQFEGSPYFMSVRWKEIEFPGDAHELN